MISLRSKITQAVLGYLFLHKEESLYVGELSRKLGLDKGNLSRKLSELEQIGILKSDVRGRERFFSINKKYPLAEEYSRIVIKSLGIEAELKKTLQQIIGIQRAFLFGSYATEKMDAASDIDLMVIGTHSAIALRKAIAKIQKKLNRQINAISVHSQEYDTKKRKDPFFKRVELSKKVELT